LKHRHISVNSCFNMYFEQISTFKGRRKWNEQKITYFLSVGLSLSSIVPVKEKFTYMKKWHIWRIESQPYFTIVYYWFGISIDNLYTPTNKEHLLTLFFWHYVWEEEKFENTKGVIRNCKSKNRQRNSQKKKTDKKINNELQNIAQKTKDRATPTLLKPVWI
jgi:hypothetical protein